jgi:phosphoesterase RecJ-like protein
MRIGADLIDAGADNYDVNHRLYEVKSHAELAARRLMLTNTEYYLDGRVAILMIDAAFRKESGALDDDIGAIVSEMREVQGVDLAITLKQDTVDKSKFKISMRTSLCLNASDLCALFGGGGHARAAGASVIADTPDAAKNAVLEKVLAELK